MGYKFDTTQQTTPSGNTGEAKALLYLLSFCDESDDITKFAIDCFNDVTGMGQSCEQLYDAQAKASTNLSPAKIGCDLVTLFKNYISDFSSYFKTYTLFLGGVSSSVRISDDLEEFYFDDMKPAAKSKVKDALIEEIERRQFDIPKNCNMENSVDSFLRVVRFVVMKKEMGGYIRPLIKAKTAIMPDESRLEDIFCNIRDMQSKYKNRQGIANKTIFHPVEVEDYSRVLNRRKIELYVLQRFLNCNPIKDALPAEYQDYLNGFDPADRQEIELEARYGIGKQFLDKNNKEHFWPLLNNIVSILEEKNDLTMKEVYSRIDPSILAECQQLDRRSTLLFIAIIKEGLM